MGAGDERVIAHSLKSTPLRSRVKVIFAQCATGTWRVLSTTWPVVDQKRWERTLLAKGRRRNGQELAPVCHEERGNSDEGSVCRADRRSVRRAREGAAGGSVRGDRGG